MNSDWTRMHGRLNPLHEQLFRPIPAVLYSFETGEPFRLCTGCGKDLWREQATYVVEKVINRGEVLVEYAMCRECLGPVREGISAHSRQQLEAFFKEHRKIWQDLFRCNLCLQPLEEAIAYKLVADCSGDKLFSLAHPTAICGMCHHGISGCLSEETKRNRDKFRDFFTPDPPQAAKTLPSLPVEGLPT